MNAKYDELLIRLIHLTNQLLTNGILKSKNNDEGKKFSTYVIATRRWKTNEKDENSW